MLVLSRKPSEKIIIDVYGEIITIELVSIKPASAKLGVTCARGIQVDREEIFIAKLKEALTKEINSAE